MSVRRIAIAAFVVGMAIVVARVAAPSHASHFRYSTALACGVERWRVKTPQDRPRLLRVHSISTAQSVSHERPTPLLATRLPFERHIFSVDAAVTLVRHEADEDFHLVLQSGTDQMIAESPSSSCALGATPYRRRQMRAARTKLRLCSQARVVGRRLLRFQARTDGRGAECRSSCIRSLASSASRVREGRAATECPGALACENDALRRSRRFERRWWQTVYGRAGLAALCRGHFRAGRRALSGVGDPDRSRTLRLRHRSRVARELGGPIEDLPRLLLQSEVKKTTGLPAAAGRCGRAGRAAWRGRRPLRRRAVNLRPNKRPC